MGSDLLWRTDSNLRDAVAYRLEWEADVNPSNIGTSRGTRSGAGSAPGSVAACAIRRRPLGAYQVGRKEGLKAVVSYQ